MSALVRFEDVDLDVQSDPTHGWLMSNAAVESGFGVPEGTVRSTKSRHEADLVEGKHFVKVLVAASVAPARGVPRQPKVMWTKRGVIRLGFHLDGDRARRFRDFAEDLVVEAMAPTFAIPQTYAEALMAAAQLAAEVDRQAARVAELEAAAAFADRLAGEHGDYSVRESAQILNRDSSISTGERRLFVTLKAIGWLDRNGIPYQGQIDRGRLVQRIYEFRDKAGELRVGAQVRVTPKGLRDLHARLGGTSALVLLQQQPLAIGGAS